MKLTLFPILSILVLASCGNSITKSDSSSELEKTTTFDTIRIDLDAARLIAEERSDRWAKMSNQELIDSLLALNVKKGISEIKESEVLFGDYKQMEKYYSINIPRSFYRKLFPKEEISIDKRKISRTKIEQAKRQVILTEGYEVIEERKYKYLYAIMEKENYLLMLLTKQGKYSPELELFTVTKDDLQVVDNLELYGGIYDSYDINYKTSEFFEGYSKVQVTKVQNLEFNKVKLDTVETFFNITNVGEIVQ